MSGMEDIFIVGGTEMISYNSATADPSVPPMIDAGNLRLRAKHPQSQQGVCADAVATFEIITREDVDKLAVVSQQRTARAINEGRFDKSLVPSHIEDGSLALDKEEFSRPNTALESLSGLKTVFDMFAGIPVDNHRNTYGDMVTKKFPEFKVSGIDHVHHAGNSPSVIGRSALLIASERTLEENGWTPRARTVATANMRDCPTLMLNAPVPADLKVLETASLTFDGIDLWAVNDAFSVVTERFIRKMNVVREKINVNGEQWLYDIRLERQD